MQKRTAAQGWNRCYCHEARYDHRSTVSRQGKTRVTWIRSFRYLDRFLFPGDREAQLNDRLRQGVRGRRRVFVYRRARSRGRVLARGRIPLLGLFPPMRRPAHRYAHDLSRPTAAEAIAFLLLDHLLDVMLHHLDVPAVQIVERVRFEHLAVPNGVRLPEWRRVIGQASRFRIHGIIGLLWFRFCETADRVPLAIALSRPSWRKLIDRTAGRHLRRRTVVVDYGRRHGRVIGRVLPLVPRRDLTAVENPRSLRVRPRLRDSRQ